MPLVLREIDLHSPVSPSVKSLPLLTSPALSCTSPPQALSPYPHPDEYWLEQLVRDTKWHTSAKLLRVTPAEPHTERFTAALEKEGVKYYLPGVSKSEGPGGYQYKANLHHIRPSPASCTFEAYLERALQAATAKMAVVIPYKHYTELFTRKLDREKIPWQLKVHEELKAQKELDLKREFPVYLSQVEPSFILKSTLLELLEKDILPHRNERMVRIIPSMQTQILAEALAERNIPHHIACPRSAQDYRREYQVDLTRMVLE